MRGHAWFRSRGRACVRAWCGGGGRHHECGHNSHRVDTVIVLRRTHACCGGSGGKVGGGTCGAAMHQRSSADAVRLRSGVGATLRHDWRSGEVQRVGPLSHAEGFSQRLGVCSHGDTLCGAVSMHDVASFVATDRLPLLLVHLAHDPCARKPLCVATGSSSGVAGVATAEDSSGWPCGFPTAGCCSELADYCDQSVELPRSRVLGEAPLRLFLYDLCVALICSTVQFAAFQMAC